MIEGGGFAPHHSLRCVGAAQNTVVVTTAPLPTTLRNHPTPRVSPHPYRTVPARSWNSILDSRMCLLTLRAQKHRATHVSGQAGAAMHQAMGRTHFLCNHHGATRHVHATKAAPRRWRGVWRRCSGAAGTSVATRVRGNMQCRRTRFITAPPQPASRGRTARAHTPAHSRQAVSVFEPGPVVPGSRCCHHVAGAPFGPFRVEVEYGCRATLHQCPRDVAVAAGLDADVLGKLTGIPLRLRRRSASKDRPIGRA